ncbi:MAG: stage II sporulation protein M [Fuerstiella sp.]|nr:stage II sporulation protein M [Fuerstiella sp.]MCP4859611.1 stage II sporulation protein M [Fuerstiella sp.]
MNRERFIRQRRDDWQQFETLLNGMKKRRLTQWSGNDITRLSGLYRSVCYDLSLVQSREWGARLEQYLNDLVAQGHNCLYRSPPGSLDTALKFLSIGFPRLLRVRRHFFFVSLALFAVPFLIAMVIAAIDPVMAERIIDKTQMEQAGESYSQDLYREIDASFAEERSYMTGFYVWNNVGIAFRCFALGAFFGIGTVVTLLFNGIMLGAVTGYIINQGFADNFFSFAISHGSFELTAIVISGAAGLLLGWGMVHPGELSRRESLRVHGLDAIKLASGAGFMLVIAALIEGYFSPMALPHSLKYAVGTMLWALVFVYLVHGGRDTTDTNSTIDGRRRRFSAAHTAEYAK